MRFQEPRPQPQPMAALDRLELVINPSDECYWSGQVGISGLLWKRRSELGELLFYEETSNRYYGRFIGHSGSNNIWYPLRIAQRSAAYTGTLRPNPFILYNHSLEAEIGPLTLPYRDYLEGLVKAQDIIPILILGDGSGWIVAESVGGRFGANANTGNRGGDGSRWPLSWSAISDYPIRRVSDEYLNQITIPDSFRSLCGRQWTNLCDLDWSEVCSLPF